MDPWTWMKAFNIQTEGLKSLITDHEHMFQSALDRDITDMLVPLLEVFHLAVHTFTNKRYMVEEIIVGDREGSGKTGDKHLNLDQLLTNLKTESSQSVHLDSNRESLAKPVKDETNAPDLISGEFAKDNAKSHEYEERRRTRSWDIKDDVRTPAKIIKAEQLGANLVSDDNIADADNLEVDNLHAKNKVTNRRRVSARKHIPGTRYTNSVSKVKRGLRNHKSKKKRKNKSSLLTVDVDSDDSMGLVVDLPPSDDEDVECLGDPDVLAETIIARKSDFLPNTISVTSTLTDRVNFHEYRCFVCEDQCLSENKKAYMEHWKTHHIITMGTRIYIPCDVTGCGKKYHLDRNRLVASSVYSAVSVYLNHLVKKHQAPIPKFIEQFPCPHKDCGKSFLTRRFFSIHCKAHESHVTCHHCGRDMKPFSLAAHMKKCTSDSPKEIHRQYRLMFTEFRCFLCDDDEESVVYPHERELTKHINKTHISKLDTGRFALKCKFCSQVFLMSAGGLNSQGLFGSYAVYCKLRYCLQHMIRWHSFALPPYVEAFMCPHPDCDFMTVKKETLQTHLMSHDNQRLPCQKCGKMLKPLSLKVHLKTCQVDPALIRKEKKSYPCPICDRTLSSPNAQIYHVKAVHQQVHDFLCSVCSRTFVDKNGLENHMYRKHKVNISKREVQTCEMCSYTSIDKTDMDGHKRKTHSQNEFVCNICDKVFKARAYLHSHMQSHQEKLHKCEYCAYATTRRQFLKAHVNAQHLKKFFTCPNNTCDYKSGYSSNLDKHLKLCKKRTGNEAESSVNPVAEVATTATEVSMLSELAPIERPGNIAHPVPTSVTQKEILPFATMLSSEVYARDLSYWYMPSVTQPTTVSMASKNTSAPVSYVTCSSSMANSDSILALQMASGNTLPTDHLENSNMSGETMVPRNNMSANDLPADNMHLHHDSRIPRTNMLVSHRLNSNNMGMANLASSESLSADNIGTTHTMVATHISNGSNTIGSMGTAHTAIGTNTIGSMGTAHTAIGSNTIGSMGTAHTAIGNNTIGSMGTAHTAIGSTIPGNVNNVNIPGHSHMIDIAATSAEIIAMPSLVCSSETPYAQPSCDT